MRNMELHDLKAGIPYDEKDIFLLLLLLFSFYVSSRRSPTSSQT